MPFGSWELYSYNAEMPNGIKGSIQTVIQMIGIGFPVLLAHGTQSLWTWMHTHNITVFTKSG